MSASYRFMALVGFIAAVITIYQFPDWLSKRDAPAVHVTTPPPPREVQSPPRERDEPSTTQPVESPSTQDATPSRSVPSIRRSEPARVEPRVERPPAPREIYLNTSSLSGAVALVAAGENGIEGELVQALGEQGISVRRNVFTSAAASDGILDQMRVGNRATLQALGLSGSGGIVFAELELDRLVDTGRLTKTNARLNVIVVSFNGQTLTRSVEARGAGFDASAARRQAVERVAERFANDSAVIALLR